MADKRQIINIINFMRGIDSEIFPDGVTFATAKNQVELLDKYNFKSTILVQYDTLFMDNYREMFASLDKDRYEFGIWLEIIQPLAAKCGIEWHGEREWDGHCHCGYSMGYTKEQRIKMIDEFFRAFKEFFGHYPRVFGSWFFDSFTARYIADTYGLDAMCNCKEQYGTDGYTLWGGYYGQAYYPSRTNVFMPAQSREEQLNVPLFRMLGSDQVYQYDYQLDVNADVIPNQKVITLEPVYPEAGGSPRWVDWYIGENFNGECLSFGYAQAGQENSMGWKRIQDGYRYQLEKFAKMQADGEIEIEQLGESGKWFKEQYTETPASTITAHCAYDDPDKDTVWYCSKNYRVNLYGENHQVRIRDLHIFDETVEDPFENKICTENAATYDSLPAVDGVLYSGNGIRSGMYIYDKATDKPIEYDFMEFKEKSDKICAVNFVGSDDSITFNLNENEFSAERKDDFVLRNLIGRNSPFLPKVVSCNEKELVLNYKDSKYSLKLECGKFIDKQIVESENGKVKVSFNVLK